MSSPRTAEAQSLGGSELTDIGADSDEPVVSPSLSWRPLCLGSLDSGRRMPSYPSTVGAEDYNACASTVACLCSPKSS